MDDVINNLVDTLQEMTFEDGRDYLRENYTIFDKDSPKEEYVDDQYGFKIIWLCDEWFITYDQYWSATPIL